MTTAEVETFTGDVERLAGEFGRLAAMAAVLDGRAEAAEETVAAEWGGPNDLPDAALDLLTPLVDARRLLAQLVCRGSCYCM